MASVARSCHHLLHELEASLLRLVAITEQFKRNFQNVLFVRSQKIGVFAKENIDHGDGVVAASGTECKSNMRPSKIDLKRNNHVLPASACI